MTKCCSGHGKVNLDVREHYRDKMCIICDDDLVLGNHQAWEVIGVHEYGVIKRHFHITADKT
jgi:hypothetical protein